MHVVCRRVDVCICTFNGLSEPPPPSPQVQLSITGDTVMRQAAVLFLHVACVHVYFTNNQH